MLAALCMRRTTSYARSVRVYVRQRTKGFDLREKAMREVERLSNKFGAVDWRLNTTGLMY